MYFLKLCFSLFYECRFWGNIFFNSFVMEEYMQVVVRQNKYIFLSPNEPFIRFNAILLILSFHRNLRRCLGSLVVYIIQLYCRCDPWFHLPLSGLVVFSTINYQTHPELFYISHVYVCKFGFCGNVEKWVDNINSYHPSE